MPKRPLRDRLLAGAGQLHARWMTRRVLAAFERADSVQDRLLARIVERNADSDFGREHGFSRVRGYRDFAAQVPVRNYDAMRPYMDRVRQGHPRALFGADQPILMFAMTSGTTAEPKHIPITRQALADWRAGWNVWGLKALLDHPGSLLRDIVQVTSPMNDHHSPTGVPCGAITGLLAATQKKVVRRYYVAPLAVAGIRESSAKYYAIMRLAVARDVAFVVTANPATLLLLAQTADQHKEQILRDVRDGTLWADLPIDSDVRRELAPHLRPDPGNARRLDKLAERHRRLLPKHYWDLAFRAHWIGGTMGLYESQIPEYFGETPVRDIGLLASEGRMSIPMDDGTPAGPLAVTGQFFEFVPAEQYGSLKPNLLRSHELAVGNEYFLVITNHSGCYRYDLGDRVRVTGTLARTPIIEFLSRDAHTASLSGEKLTEDQLVAGMDRACQAGGGPAVVDFVLAPRWGRPPRYRLYVEAADAQRDPDLAGRLDRALCDVSIEYASKRDSLRLGPIELATLPDGSIADRNRGLRRRRARTAEQFKHQYLLARPGSDDDFEALAATAPPISQ